MEHTEPERRYRAGRQPPAVERCRARKQRPWRTGRQRRLRRRQDQGPRRARGRPQAARDVHRLDRPDRAASPRLRDRRQLDRRSAGRLLRSGQRHDSHRRLGDGHRQRPRHPDRSARERQIGRGGRPHRAARRRQVRQRQLQGVRRPARRRRLGRECAVGNARSRDLAQQPGVPAELRARHADRRARDHRHDQAPRHQGHLQARRRDLRDDGVQLRHPRAAPARARVPQRRHHHHARRRARRQEAQLPLRRRHRLVRHAPEQEQGAGQREADLHARRAGRHRRRDRAAVERQLHRDDLRLRQQHQHPRRRHAPLRLQGGADAHDQLVRDEEQPREGSEGKRLRRGHPRGAHRRHQRQDSAPAVRRADQDQARQHRGQGHRRGDRQRQARRLPRGEPGGRQARSSARRSTPPGPARPPARPATWSAARARWTAARCPASWPTARSAIRPSASSTSSKAIRPEDRPSRGAIAASRPSCRSRARF